jgi:hypothetical protein
LCKANSCRPSFTGASIDIHEDSDLMDTGTGDSGRHQLEEDTRTSEPSTSIDATTAASGDAASTLDTPDMPALHVPVQPKQVHEALRREEPDSPEDSEDTRRNSMVDESNPAQSVRRLSEWQPTVPTINDVLAITPGSVQANAGFDHSSRPANHGTFGLHAHRI